MTTNTRALSTLAGTVEKLKTAKKDSPTVKQLAKQVGALQDGFLSLADALFEETRAVQGELQRWQTERESWSRSMDRLSGEVTCRLNEVDRLRAEASSLIQAAKCEAGAVAQTELHGMNSRIDELHKSTMLMKDDMQKQLREFSASVKACEKIANLQQEVWDLQHWRDVNTPQMLTDMVVGTVNDVVRSHTEELIEEIQPSHMKGEIVKVHKESRSATVALAKDISALADELKATRNENQAATQFMEDYLHRLEDQVSQMERSNPLQWLGALQEKVDVVVEQHEHNENTVHDVFKTILTDVGQLSTQVQRLEHKVEDMGAWSGEKRDNGILRNAFNAKDNGFMGSSSHEES